MRKLIKEIKALWLLTIYFAVWFGMLVLVKRLLLAQYQIEFRGASLALVGALVTAKVVIVMEHVSSVTSTLRRWPLLPSWAHARYTQSYD